MRSITKIQSIEIYQFFCYNNYAKNLANFKGKNNEKNINLRRSSGIR